MKKYYVQATIFLTIAAESKEEAKRKTKERKGLEDAQIEIVNPYRTNPQNNALHLWFQQLSDELNEQGCFANKIIRGNVEMYWTPVLVKEILWKGIQKTMFGKDSTRKLLKAEEIDKIYDVINKVIAERTGGQVQVPPFPSLEELEKDVSTPDQ